MYQVPFSTINIRTPEPTIGLPVDEVLMSYDNWLSAVPTVLNDRLHDWLDDN